MKQLTLILILSLMTGQAFCAPKVIAQVGPTVAVSLYLKSIDEGVHNTQIILPKNKMASMNLVANTKALTPGPVKTKKIHAPLLAQPIYLIGDDDFSKRWLKKYVARLQAIHAVGFIVNARSHQTIKDLEKQFHLQLIPINGTAISHHFGLSHYPVLISQHRIEQ